MDAEQLISRLRGIESAVVSGGAELLGVRDLTEGYADLRLRCLVPQPQAMVGYAVTMKVDSTTPGLKPDPAGFVDLRAAVLAAPKPAVMVIEESGSNPDKGCHMGDVVGTMLSRNGVVGFVSGSGLRDLEGIKAMGVWGFGRGTVVAHGCWTITAVNVEVEVAGLRIQPGDLLHGDGDGLLSVPTDEPERLMELIEDLQKRESHRRATADEGWNGWANNPYPVGTSG